jgi:ADP-heptose:LPS heptosyltransferase
VGIPLCFFLSAVEAIRKIVLPSRTAEGMTPKRILFVGLSEMGSNLLAYGAIEKIKAIYPQAQVCFLVFEENKEAIALLGNIENKNILTVRNTNLRSLFVDTLRFVRKVSREKMDAVIDMELFSRYSSALSYFTGARKRVGFHGYSIGGLYRGHLHTHHVQFNPHKHISKNFMALAGALVADPSDRPLLKEKLQESDLNFLKLDLEESSKDRMWNKLRCESPGITNKHKIVIINPDIKTRLPLRRWPLEKYLELAERLLANPSIYVISVGIGDSDFHLDIKSERHINLIGKTSLRELIDLFSISKVLVSHDGGPVHLASVTAIATVVMFGPETPSLYGPSNKNIEVITSDLFCSPCFSPFNNRTSPCENNVCMKTITVDEVFEAVERKLGGG